jgi:hypothetical protein
MVSAMVFNDTFNNISVVSWLYVLLVEKTGVDGEYHQTAQVTDKLYILLLDITYVECQLYSWTKTSLQTLNHVDNMWRVSRSICGA